MLEEEHKQIMTKEDREQMQQILTQMIEVYKKYPFVVDITDLTYDIVINGALQIYNNKKANNFLQKVEQLEIPKELKEKLIQFHNAKQYNSVNFFKNLAQEINEENYVDNKDNRIDLMTKIYEKLDTEPENQELREKIIKTTISNLCAGYDNITDINYSKKRISFKNDYGENVSKEVNTLNLPLINPNDVSDYELGSDEYRKVLGLCNILEIHGDCLLHDNIKIIFKGDLNSKENENTKKFIEENIRQKIIETGTLKNLTLSKIYTDIINPLDKIKLKEICNNFGEVRNKYYDIYDKEKKIIKETGGEDFFYSFEHWYFNQQKIRIEKEMEERDPNFKSELFKECSITFKEEIDNAWEKRKQILNEYFIKAEEVKNSQDNLNLVNKNDELDKPSTSYSQKQEVKQTSKVSDKKQSSSLSKMTSMKGCSDKQPAHTFHSNRNNIVDLAQSVKKAEAEKVREELQEQEQKLTL